MIASLFRKSTPLNYSLVIIAVVFFFFLYQVRHVTSDNSLFHIGLKFALLGIIFASLFIANFIVKKNGLSKDSAYTVLFYLVFLMFFPSLLDNKQLVLANFFILLALRRMVSLHSLKAPKEKIFDASLWVFVAMLFHFWCVLFVVLVFISILFHGSRDYRNWFLPFIAFFGAAIIFVFASLLFNEAWLTHLLQQSMISTKFNYFTNNFQNLALSIYATIGLFFLVSMLLTMSNRPLILHTSYKKMIWAFFIGIAILVISPFKSNELLVFTFAPLATMATAHIEVAQVRWQKEAVLFAVVLCGVFAFFSQL